MQELANSLIDSGIQCWACPVFDNLFAVVSNVAGNAYQHICFFSIAIFCVLFAFYLLNVFWQHIVKGGKDSLFDKTLRPVMVKSLIALSLLTLGLVVPRFISAITFEPVAIMTLQFSNAMLPADYVIPEYTNAIQLGSEGFFNPALRDTIMQILETSVANFQVYIKIGIAIIDSAFSLKALFGFGSLVKHIIVFFIGLFLTYNFVKLFIKYSFCFMDVIVAMAMFAFFFPLSVVFFVFKKAADIPSWMKSMGNSFGGGQVKQLINAIASMASTILTYTIIMLIIRGFLDSHGVDASTIHNSTESLLDFDLENSDAMQITFMGSIVLVYVINYIANQIPSITKKIMSTFGVSQSDSISKEMGENVFKLTQIVADQTKNVIKTIIDPESVTTKSEKKDEKK